MNDANASDPRPRRKRPRSVRLWLRSFVGLLCVLIGVGAFAGSLWYSMLTLICVALGGLLLPLAGILWLVGRPSGTARLLATACLATGLVGLLQIIPGLPLMLVFTHIDLELAKADCEEVFPAIEAWKAEHGEYPEDLGELLPHPGIEPAHSGISTSIATRTGAGLYRRENNGYSVSVLDPGNLSNDAQYTSAWGRWNR